MSERLAKDAFTFGTTAVLPFYILMVAAPKAELVRIYMCCCLYGCKWFGFDSMNHMSVGMIIIIKKANLFVSPWCRLKSVCEVTYQTWYSEFYMRILFTFRGLLIRSGFCSQANTGVQRYGYMSYSHCSNITSSDENFDIRLCFISNNPTDNKEQWNKLGGTFWI